MNENFAKIETEITQIKQENIRLKNNLEPAINFSGKIPAKKPE